MERVERVKRRAGGRGRDKEGSIRRGPISRSWGPLGRKAGTRSETFSPRFASSCVADNKPTPMGNGRAVLVALLLGAIMFLMSLIVGPSPVNTNSLSNKSFSNESAMLALGAARWMPPSSLKLSGGLGADASMSARGTSDAAAAREECRPCDGGRRLSRSPRIKRAPAWLDGPTEACPPCPKKRRAPASNTASSRTAAPIAASPTAPIAASPTAAAPVAAAATSSAVTLDQTMPLLQNVAETESTRQATDAAPAAAKAPLPVHEQGRLSNERARDTDRSMTALLSHIDKFGYKLTPEERKCWEKREGGYASGQLVVNGFPVNPDNPWMNPTGLKLAESMVSHGLQIGSLGLYETCFLRIDIHPGAARWNSGTKLSKAVMLKTAQCAESVASG